jgi:hypothetical protein
MVNTIVPKAASKYRTYRTTCPARGTTSTLDTASVPAFPSSTSCTLLICTDIIIKVIARIEVATQVIIWSVLKGL